METGDGAAPDVCLRILALHPLVVLVEVLERHDKTSLTVACRNTASSDASPSMGNFRHCGVRSSRLRVFLLVLRQQLVIPSTQIFLFSVVFFVFPGLGSELP